MRSFPVHLGRGLGILLGVVATTMASGQPPVAKAPAGSVHKLVVYQGPNRSVHYITTGNLSAGDRRAAFDLERAENELSYVSNLQALKQQYVNSERILEPKRRAVQQYLYGRRISYGGSSRNWGSNTPGGGYGGGGYGGWGYGGWGWPAYYPYYYPAYGLASGFYGFANSNTYSETFSLQYGMGDEGRLKNALVGVIAREATTDYAASALHGYDTALGHAAGSAVLSRDLNLPKGATAPPPAASFRKGANVTVWVGDTRHVGTVKDDRPDAVVLQTDKGEVTVRKSSITRWQETGKSGK